MYSNAVPEDTESVIRIKYCEEMSWRTADSLIAKNDGEKAEIPINSGTRVNLILEQQVNNLNSGMGVLRPA